MEHWLFQNEKEAQQYQEQDSQVYLIMRFSRWHVFIPVSVFFRKIEVFSDFGLKKNTNSLLYIKIN